MSIRNRLLTSIIFILGAREFPGNVAAAPAEFQERLADVNSADVELADGLFKEGKFSEAEKLYAKALEHDAANYHAKDWRGARGIFAKQ